MTIYYAGIDLGSSYTKAYILDNNKNIVGEGIQKTGIDFKQAAFEVLDQALTKAGITKKDVDCIVSTGVGRDNCDFSNLKKTEISCLVKGAYHYFKNSCTIIDIGGQDNKIIKMNDKGEISSFKMNRKCAAGTGSFLEEIAHKLEIPSFKMNKMAKEVEKCVHIGSFCTVFTQTEIVHHIRSGKNTNEIIRGVYGSVVQRILEMESLDNNVIITGGTIAHNPVLIDIFTEKVNVKIVTPPSPQFVGALGACLYAYEHHKKEKSL